MVEKNARELPDELLMKNCGIFGVAVVEEFGE
jgi:hypothetical protein